jgi:hypothetical protein
MSVTKYNKYLLIGVIKGEIRAGLIEINGGMMSVVCCC